MNNGNGIVSLIKHYEVKLEVIKNLVDNTCNDEVNIGNTLMCSLLVNEKMLLQEFIEKLEKLIS